MTRPAAQKSDIAYRPDIDGLRAIAVSLVLLSHLRVPHTLGGFIGVDIFFVISGYLITGNIERSLAKGRFSILGFYERRFRRIIPALIGMLLATSLVAYLIFLPADLLRYARGLLAAVFSYSNLFFYWTKTGYFGANHANILLHTWSLGVEEQFYLVIPVGMMLVAGRPRAMRWMIAAAAAVSFVAAAYMALKNSSLAFYMPYLRAWELLSGSLVALGMLPRPNMRWLRESMAALAICMIAFSTIVYTSGTPFPGVAALLPCAAAVSFILIGERGKTTLSGFLSWRPVVFVGLISYSLYLWHWPITVLVGLGVVHGVRDRTVLGYAFVIVVSLLCGALSWKFVEQPFRAGSSFKFTQRHIFQLAGVSVLCVSVIAAIFLFGQGFPARFPSNALAVTAYMKAPPMRSGSCFIETNFSDFDKSSCLTEVSNKKNILLFGDSHAAVFWWGLKNELPDTNVMQATAASCAPTLGSYGRSSCSQLRRFVYEQYLPAHKIDAVVLTERWSSIQDLARLQPAIDWFRDHGTPVIVLGPVPEYSAPLPFLLALGLRWGDSTLAGRNRIQEGSVLDQQLRAKLQQQPGVQYASAWQVICPGGICAEYAGDNIPLMADVDHLTNEASINVVRELQQAGELPLR